MVVANQKGGVGKTTHDREPGRRAGPARPAGAGRSTSTRRATPPRRSPSSTAAARPRRTTPWSTACRSPRWCTPCPDVAEPVRRAGHDRPGRRRDRAGQRGGAREPAAQGDRGPPARRDAARPARTASTTSSSTARRRWACSRSTRWWPGAEMLIPIQAEYYALEGLGQLLETVEMVKAHLNPRLRGLHDPGHDVRRPHPPGRRRGRRGAGPLRGPGRCKTTIPRSVRVSEAPSLRPDRDDLRSRVAGRAAATSKPPARSPAKGAPHEHA